MTAPSPYDMNNTVVIRQWQTRRMDQNRRAALVAEIETLERRQAGRYAALNDLAELIDRRALEIENLRRQL